MIKLMTPGPTQVRENVRLARSLETTNPDVDLDFCEEYKRTCDMIGEILHTKEAVYILSGEGILGLEAACASLTEAGDRVLVIDNGIYGRGFADFVSMYGGVPVLYTQPYDETICPIKLKEYLEIDHNFKYATIVHNDTPSGMTNDVQSIGKILNEYNIMSVVDSVSGMVGEYLNIDEAGLDIVCGGSQKAISAPVGLTIVTVSKRAITSMESRKTPIPAFYANLLNFKNYYVDKWFPYTMPISDIYGLRQAILNIKNEPNIISRHEKIAKATRQALIAGGLTLYGKNGYSNNVSVFQVPEGISQGQILDIMKREHGIMLSGSFGCLAGKVIRIGHMGENANLADMMDVFQGLDQTFKALGYQLTVSMKEVFKAYLV